MYVVFEQRRKIKTRDILVEGSHVGLVDLDRPGSLELLKHDLGLGDDDVVHGAVFIGANPRDAAVSTNHGQTSEE